MKPVKHSKAHIKKDLKYRENQTPQLRKKSCMQIRKVNKGRELYVQNYDKSKSLFILQMSVILCTAHACICICLFVYVCVCLCVWGNIINTDKPDNMGMF